MVDVFAGVSGQADLGLNEDAEHVDRVRGKGAVLSHLLQTAAPLFQGTARDWLVSPEHVLHLGSREVLTQVFLGVGAVVSGIEEAGISEASIYGRGGGATVGGEGSVTPRDGGGVRKRLKSVLHHPAVDESDVSFT